MERDAILVEIRRELKRIGEPKPVWVNAETIKEKTGLDNNGLDRFRKNNKHLLKKVGNKKFLYDISAIPPVMIKNKEV